MPSRAAARPSGERIVVAPTCHMDQPGGRVLFASFFTVTRVPTPLPLSLFLAGVVGLALSRRRKQLGVQGALCLQSRNTERMLTPKRKG